MSNLSHRAVSMARYGTRNSAAPLDSMDVPVWLWFIRLPSREQIPSRRDPTSRTKVTCLRKSLRERSYAHQWERSAILSKHPMAFARRGSGEAQRAPTRSETPPALGLWSRHPRIPCAAVCRLRVRRIVRSVRSARSSAARSSGAGSPGSTTQSETGAR